MSRKHRHNAKIRDRILRVAGNEFRRHGYRRTSINQVMAAAGLTRGAFYTHFASKEDLFVNCLRSGDPLLDMLKSRSRATDDSLRMGVRHILGHMLKSPGREVVTMLERIEDMDWDPESALGQATSLVIADILDEAVAGSEGKDEIAVKLCATLGALTLARACSAGGVRDSILSSARDFVTSR